MAEPPPGPQRIDQNHAEAERSLSQAEQDHAARAVRRQAEHFEWACFQTQQAAEKALKAFFFARGRRGMHGHSVARLLDDATQVEPAFRGVHAARELDQYYIPTRYPNGLPDQAPHEFYTDEDADRCLRHAHAVLELCQRLIRARGR